MSEPDELPEHLLAKLRINIPGYELLDKIKAGGQGTVYRAREMTSGLTVAIKVLHGGPLADESSRQRLLRETASLKALNHPNIVCAIESGRTSIGLDYLVMNYVDGRPLDDVWTDAAFAAAVAPEPPARLRLFKKICEVVQAAHIKGITHRDLSPSNILIDPKGEPHLLDFGLASTAFNKMLNPAGISLSLSCQFLGKLQYAAPEQLKGGRDAVDIRTDVYALGVIFYQILTNGILPYEVGDNLADAIKNIVHTRPLLPSSILAAHKISVTRRSLKKGSPLVNPTIEAIVLKALEKEKTDRYQSSGELSMDIGRYLAGQPVSAPLPESNRSTGKTPRKLRWRVMAGAVSILVVIVGVAWVTIKNRNDVTTAVSVPTRASNNSASPIASNHTPITAENRRVVTSPPPIDLPGHPETNPTTPNWLAAGLESKDFAGWDLIGEASPSVQDGLVSLTGSGTRAGLMCRRGDFSECTFTLEVAASADVKAWIGVRLNDHDGNWVGYTSFISGSEGDLQVGHISQKFAKWGWGLPDKTTVPAGQFFEISFYIGAEGTVWVKVNGETTAGVKRDIDAQGHLGIFIESGTLRIRNVRVETAKSRAAAKYKPDNIWTDTLGTKLAYVPAGEFEMGSSANEPGRFLAREGLHYIKNFSE